MNLAALQDLLPGTPPPSADWYRNVAAAYVEQIDEIGPSLLHGWRYNPRSEFGVLYLSRSAACAEQEILRQVGGRRDWLGDRVVGRFTVTLEKCLDLTDGEILRRLEITREQLVAVADFTICQALARESRRLGFEGILAPSAVGDECLTLVVFRDRLQPPAACECDRDSIRAYP